MQMLYTFLLVKNMFYFAKMSSVLKLFVEVQSMDCLRLLKNE